MGTAFLEVYVYVMLCYVYSPRLNIIIIIIKKSPQNDLQSSTIMRVTICKHNSI